MVTRETERNRKWCKGAGGGELEGGQRKTFWLHRMKELLPSQRVLCPLQEAGRGEVRGGPRPQEGAEEPPF